MRSPATFIDTAIASLRVSTGGRAAQKLVDKALLVLAWIQVARMLRRLEDLFAQWQVGTLPILPVPHASGTPPTASAPHSPRLYRPRTSARPCTPPAQQPPPPRPRRRPRPSPVHPSLRRRPAAAQHSIQDPLQLSTA